MQKVFFLFFSKNIYCVVSLKLVCREFVLLLDLELLNPESSFFPSHSLSFVNLF